MYTRIALALINQNINHGEKMHKVTFPKTTSPLDSKQFLFNASQTEYYPNRFISKRL